MYQCIPQTKPCLDREFQIGMLCNHIYIETASEQNLGQIIYFNICMQMYNWYKQWLFVYFQQTPVIYFTLHSHILNDFYMVHDICKCMNRFHWNTYTIFEQKTFIFAWGILHCRYIILLSNKIWIKCF